MVNQPYNPVIGNAADLFLGPAHTCLVNHGRDTKITFEDGSSIVLKGVTHADAVLSTAGSPGAQSRRQLAAR